jgi:tetratricopeptide (TPR) repeat protein
VQTAPGRGVISHPATTALAVSVSLSLAFGLALGAGAAAQPAPVSRDWKTLRTPHLTVVGDASAGDLQRLGRDIERFRDAIASALPAVRFDEAIPTILVVFRDDAAMRPFKPRVRGKVADFADAYYLGAPDVQYVVLAATNSLPGGLPVLSPTTLSNLAAGTRLPSRVGYQAAYRGYVDDVVRRSLRRSPEWLVAGLREFYGSFDVRDSDRRTVVGGPVQQHVLALQHVSPVPLAELTADDTAALARDADSIRRTMATAWGLTHYLLVGKGGAMRPALAAFIDAVERGTPPAAAFHQVFGDDLAPLEKEVRDHLKLKKLPALVLASSAAPPPAAVPMLDADALALQADLMARIDAPEDAEPMLARALSVDPGHVGAQVARVRQRLAQEKVPEALDLLGQGALAASERVDVQLLRAHALREAERFAESVAVYRQLAAAQPSSPSVHYGMSLSLMGAGDPEAVAAFTRCLSLRQGGSWFRSRQRDALRLGLDAYVASDAINWVRRNGWPANEDASYLMLAKAFTELRQKKAADAAATLTEIAAHHEPGDWMSTLVAFFRGELSGDALVAKAGDDGRRTEAHAYAGIKAHIEGDRTTAQRHLAWVRTSGRRDFIEYGHALGELRRLARAERTP